MLFVADELSNSRTWRRVEAPNRYNRNIKGKNSSDVTEKLPASTLAPPSKPAGEILLPNGYLKRLWDLTGIILVGLQIFHYFGNRLDSSLIYTLVDIFFICDIFVRFNTAFVGDDGNLVVDIRKIRIRYLRGWFFFDFLLTIPYGNIWQLWQSRPALKLLAIKQGRQPILEFFRSREFRKSVFKLIREHRAERKMLQQTVPFFFDAQPLKKTVLRRTQKLFGAGFMALRNMRVLGQYSSTARTLKAIVISLRTWSILSTLGGSLTITSTETETSTGSNADVAADTQGSSSARNYNRRRSRQG
jgi:hypothetical protein